MEVKGSDINTVYGKAEVMVFKFDEETVIPIVYKRGTGVPLVRIQSQCLLGTVFMSTDCDCGAQISNSFKILFEQPHSVFIYMTNQEARGYGLFKKIGILENYHKYHDIEIARNKMNASEDMRKYDKVIEILSYLGLTRISLLTDEEKKIKGMIGSGIDVVSTRGFDIGK